VLDALEPSAFDKVDLGDIFGRILNRAA